MNIIQQIAGSIGTAMMSVILTNQVLGSQAASAYSAVTQGTFRPTGAARRARAGRSALANAFGHTYMVGLVLIVLCLVPALLLPRKRIEGATEQIAPELAAVGQ